MTTFAQVVTAVKGKFEGGKSFTVNWFNIGKEAGQAMLGQIAPQPLCRKTPIYGGVSDGISIYYIPSDFASANGIYDNLHRLNFDRVSANVFEDKMRDGCAERIFTAKYINGVQFLLVNSVTGLGYVTINEMDDASILTGDMTLSDNTYDYITGTGSISGVFSDTNTKVQGTFDNPTDLSAYLFGTFILPFQTFVPQNITSLKFRLYSSPGNYYEVDMVEALANIAVGWNIGRVNMKSKTATGAPDITAITDWELEIVCATGTSQTILIDRLAIYSTTIFSLDYVSNLMFIDKDDGTRKNAPTDMGDYVQLTDEEVQIYVYEMCRITFVEAKVASKNPREGDKFDQELARKYGAYMAKNPSNEKPISYNIEPKYNRTIILGNLNGM